MKVYEIDIDEPSPKSDKRSPPRPSASGGAAAALAAALGPEAAGSHNSSLVSAPEVEPPKDSKENLYEDPDIFKEFDNRAIEVCAVKVQCCPSREQQSHFEAIFVNVLQTVVQLES